MDGINQIHVNPQIGLTFASGLRHIVRQDPDVIMVGEIRDRETADIAIRVVADGPLRLFDPAHQRCAQRHHAPDRHGRGELSDHVFAGVSAGTAAGARDLQGVQASGRNYGCARRRRRFRHSAAPVAKCCFGSGYTARVGIFELMELNDEIRQHDHGECRCLEITKAARRNGMRNLREDGWIKVAEGRHDRGRSDARDARVLDG